MSNMPPPPPPPPPPMGDPGGAGYPGGARPASNGLGVAALVVGIFAFIFGFLFFPLGGFLGIIAIVLGFVARGKAKRGEATNGGMAIAGIVLGAIGLLVALAIGVVLGIFLADNVDKITNCADLPEAEQQECIEDQFGN